MDLYADNILDHYRSPRHKGEGSGHTIAHSEKNISCGDEVTVFLTIEGGIIHTMTWNGVGCAISQAGISMLSEEIEGMNMSDVLALKKDDIYELLGVPIGPRRFKCALICLHAVKNAILLWQKKKPQSWLETVEIEES